MEQRLQWPQSAVCSADIRALPSVMQTRRSPERRGAVSSSHENIRDCKFGGAKVEWTVPQLPRLGAREAGQRCLFAEKYEPAGHTKNTSSKLTCTTPHRQ